MVLLANAAGGDHVLTLNSRYRSVAERLRSRPVLIPDAPGHVESLEATIAHLEALAKPSRRPDPPEPTGSGFAASLDFHPEMRREIFDRLGIDEHAHAFHLDRELMKAVIAPGAGQELLAGVPVDRAR